MARAVELFQKSRLDSVTDVTTTFGHPIFIKFFGPAFLRPFNDDSKTDYIERMLKKQLLQGEEAQERRVGRIQDITLRVTTNITQHVDHKFDLLKAGQEAMKAEVAATVKAEIAATMAADMEAMKAGLEDIKAVKAEVAATQAVIAATQAVVNSRLDELLAIAKQQQDASLAPAPNATAGNEQRQDEV